MRIRLTLACMLSLWCGYALALDPALDVSQYGHTAWKIRDGFPTGYVQAFAQTRDGYLWLGTDVGLVRFDGVRALPWPAPVGTSLPDNRIRTLLAAKDGTLWIGTRGGLASWNRGKLIDYPRLAAGYVINALAEDGEGTIWVGLQSLTIKPGLLCGIRGANIECAGDDGLFGRAVVSINSATDGNLWVAAINGLWRWRPGPPKFYPLPDPLAGSLQILSTTSSGMVLVNTQGGILRVNDGHVERLPLPVLPQKLELNCLFADRDGGLWIGPKGGGLLHLHNGRMDTFERSDGFSGDYITSIFEDREGNVWVGTTAGLDRFRALPAITYSTRQGVEGFPAAVLAASDGSIWVSSLVGLYRWRDGQMFAYRARRASLSDPAMQGRATEVAQEVIVPGLPERASPSLFQDRNGRIWLGAGPHAGLGYLDNDRFTAVKDIPSGYINSVAQDSGGNLWVANSDGGLFRVLPDLTVQPVKLSVGAKTGDAWRIAVDPLNGGVWFGLFSGAVLYFADGQVRASYSDKDGLGKGIVNDLRIATDGAVWAATDGGLSRIKNGHIVTLTSKSGLPCDAVHSSIVDDAGSTWIYTACGLVRISSSDLDAWAAAADRGEAHPTTPMFVLSEGVLNFSTGRGATPHLTKARDGRLWFTSADGVTVVDPRHLPINSLPPPVHVEQVIADRKPYEPASQLKLPPLVRDLQIDYTALSFVAPEKNQFRYKLEGHDRDWQDAGNRRQAFFTDLDPGRYRFRVIASNNSGVWNEEGASLDVEVAPAFWQTNWFRALCVLVVLALAYMLYRLRVAQIARHFNATLDARVGERTRIARDLHDTLLQSFQGLLFRFQAVLMLLPGDPAKARQVLEGAVDQASQALTEGRDAVQGLRDAATETNDLAEAIRALTGGLTTEAADGEAASVRIHVEGAPRKLHPIVRDEVFRIADEALRNAFRHARANQVEVEIRYDVREFRLRVRDDGSGVDPAILEAGRREGHFGLPGMRERAQVIGGKLTVWSGLGAGTEVEIVVPGSRAYQAPPPPGSRLADKLLDQE